MSTSGRLRTTAPTRWPSWTRASACRRPRRSRVGTTGARVRATTGTRSCGTDGKASSPLATPTSADAGVALTGAPEGRRSDPPGQEVPAEPEPHHERDDPPEARAAGG